MSMYNPPHPGEFIKEVYLEPLNVSTLSQNRKTSLSQTVFTLRIKDRLPMTLVRR